MAQGTCVASLGSGCTLESVPMCGCDGVTVDQIPCPGSYSPKPIAYYGACLSCPGNKLDGGIGAACESSSQCAADELCAWPMNESCSVHRKGSCVPKVEGCHCVPPAACGCDGKPALTGCSAFLPFGYSLSPFAYPGPCKGTGTDAGTDAATDTGTTDGPIASLCDEAIAKINWTSSGVDCTTTAPTGWAAGLGATWQDVFRSQCETSLSLASCSGSANSYFACLASSGDGTCAPSIHPNEGETKGMAGVVTSLACSSDEINLSVCACKPNGAHCTSDTDCCAPTTLAVTCLSNQCTH